MKKTDIIFYLNIEYQVKWAFYTVVNKKRCKTVDNEKDINLLQKFMQQGADEFEQKMGSHMTYSVMRKLF